jgi:hypothetical protein
MLLVFCAVFGLMMPLTAFAAETYAAPRLFRQRGAHRPFRTGIAPLSGFDARRPAYFTRIRLTAADREGNPIAGRCMASTAWRTTRWRRP